jgi:hypothetical protein
MLPPSAGSLWERELDWGPLPCLSQVPCAGADLYSEFLYDRIGDS